MGKIVHNPYDKLVKTTLHNLERAKEFLTVHLSPIAKKYVDLDRKLELVNKEFIKSSQEELRCDIVYKTSIKNKDGYIYTHVEAQSKPEELLPIRMLAYNLEIITWHHHNIKKEIPPIANLVLYNGKQSPYPYKINFLDFLKEHKITRELLFDGVQLIDLTLHDDKEIETHPKTALMELLLKHARQRDFSLYLKNFIKSGKFMILLENSEPEYIQGILMFIADMLDSKKLSVEQTTELLTGISPQIDKNMVSVRQAIENRALKQGMKQGVQQGIQQEKFSVAQNLLKMKLDKDSISKATGLSSKQIEDLSKK